jgi:hypothetical protein
LFYSFIAILSFTLIEENILSLSINISGGEVELFLSTTSHNPYKINPYRKLRVCSDEIKTGDTKEGEIGNNPFNPFPFFLFFMM